MRVFFNGLMVCFLWTAGLNVMAENRTASGLDVAMDSLRGLQMNDITILGEGNKTLASPAPFEVLSKKTLSATAANGVSDAAKFFSGVQIKDYGGLGGMKTLSIRSLGAQHTAVSYDGIVLTDCQTGVTDLSRFSLDNVEQLSMNIGAGADIFQPARSFASSGLLSIRTLTPEFDKDANLTGKIQAKTGSFGLLDMNGTVAFKLGNKAFCNVNTSWLHSDGNFPYRLAYGDDNAAFTTEHRSNNALNAFRLETFLSAKTRKAGLWEVKTHHDQTDQGLPGAVILYNPYSSQHLTTSTDFVQTRYERMGDNGWSWMLNGKLNQTKQHYLNPDFMGASGIESYRYGQREGYLSAVVLHRFSSDLSASWAGDAALSNMSSNLLHFAEPTRLLFLNHLAVKYQRQRLLVTAGLLSTSLSERTQEGYAGQPINRLLPSLSLTFSPLKQIPLLRLRSFWKSSFRPPSFNDLYYSAIGNTNLKPENNRQFNLGATWEVEGARFLQGGLTLDFYDNRVTNKIQAIPTKNIFIWSMTNLGTVDIRGLDLSMHASGRFTRRVGWNVAWNHSYQRALDKTDSQSRTYNQQIAYTPRIYGSGRFGLDWKSWLFGYTLIYAGRRYVTGQNLAENEMPAYTEHACNLTFKQKQWSVSLAVENLWDAHYDVIRNFPMPGRSFRSTLQWNF